MNDGYLKRLQQKVFFAKIGSIAFLPSMIILFVGLAFSNLLLAIGQSLLYLSVSFAFVYSRIGWSKNKIIDTVLNQLSILLGLLGYILLFFYIAYDSKTFNIGSLMIISSFLFVFIGHLTSSSEEEMNKG